MLLFSQKSRWCYVPILLIYKCCSKFDIDAMLTPFLRYLAFCVHTLQGLYIHWRNYVWNMLLCTRRSLLLHIFINWVRTKRNERGTWCEDGMCISVPFIFQHNTQTRNYLPKHPFIEGPGSAPAGKPFLEVNELATCLQLAKVNECWTDTARGVVVTCTPSKWMCISAINIILLLLLLLL